MVLSYWLIPEYDFKLCYNSFRERSFEFTVHYSFEAIQSELLTASINTYDTDKQQKWRNLGIILAETLLAPRRSQSGPQCCPSEFPKSSESPTTDREKNNFPTKSLRNQYGNLNLGREMIGWLSEGRVCSYGVSDVIGNVSKKIQSEKTALPTK
jgi:hypothetical protein